MAKWCRSATGVRRYVAVGRRPGHLYPHLDYLAGFRGRAERAFLQLPTPLIAAGDVANSEILLTLQTLDRSVPSPIRSGHFLATGYYKNTHLVGPVELVDGKRTFVKVFKTPHGAESDING